MPTESDARVWLRANGFAHVADEIDKIMASWEKRGVTTRRSWWEALGGTQKGKPARVEGFTFPILAAVRLRRGLPPVAGAIELPPGTVVPEQIEQARWAKDQPSVSAPTRGPRKQK
jgi:hypothetical protein